MSRVQLLEADTSIDRLIGELARVGVHVSRSSVVDWAPLEIAVAADWVERELRHQRGLKTTRRPKPHVVLAAQGPAPKGYVDLKALRDRIRSSAEQLCVEEGVAARVYVEMTPLAKARAVRIEVRNASPDDVAQSQETKCQTN